jgi:hypothetical protein
MKAVFAISFIVTILACNNSSTTRTTYDSAPVEIPKTPEQLKAELKESEQSDPTRYLDATGTYKENFWGDKIKVQCKITNSATLAKFKDALIEVTYYAKSKTVLGTKQYTVYEIFTPNSSKTVEMKIDNYKDVNSIGWDVIRAVALE